jgi:DNA invertase Pin-like site-specific DNA recombinase
VRQTPGLSDPDPAFAQSERVRRWVRDTGNELIAVCQDHHASVANTDRPGFKALLDIVRSGNADAVLVANLGALSPDKVTQEIMISDIRRAGATLIATDEDDLEVLRSGADDHTRMVVRDIVERVSEYREAFGLSGSDEPVVEASTVDAVEPSPHGSTDVVVELIAPTG